MILQNEELINMLIKQIQSEYQNYFLYLQSAIVADSFGLLGIKRWFYGKSFEELSHAQYIINYLEDRGVNFKLPSINNNFGYKLNSIKDLFKAGVQAEIETTKAIKSIYSFAESIKDYQTMKFLDSLIIEQTEEEDLFNTTYDYITAGNPESGIYEIDRKLSKQEFKPIIKLNKYLMPK